MQVRRWSALVGCAVIGAGLLNPAAAAEVKEIALAQQFGAIFIPLMAMERMQLIEKQAQARGIGDLKVSWAKLAGPSVMVDAILSGNLHFSAQGVPSLSLMWDRTRSSVGVKAASAITNTEIYLNTRNPNIKSIRDFTCRTVGEGLHPGPFSADCGGEGVGTGSAQPARSPDRCSRAPGCHCRGAEPDQRDHRPLCHLALPRGGNEGGPQNRDQRLSDHGW